MLVNWNLNKTESSSTGKKDKVKSPKSLPGRKGIFEDALHEAILDSFVDNTIDTTEILNGLDFLEIKLLNDPNQANFFEYKSYIKKVSDEILKRTFKIKVIKDNRKRQYEVVKILDENLRELFTQIMGKSPNRSKITILLGSIKGVLLDLNV